MVRYDTRIRVHASYGCTIKVNTRAATVTGGGFFHGGVTIEPQLDCQTNSYIDIIPEDGSLLVAGKQRLVWDPICGSERIPLCSSASEQPSLPTPPSMPSPQPSPPPFPPVPSLPLAVLSPSSAGLLAGVAGASVLIFCCLGIFVFCTRRTNKQTYGSLTTNSNDSKQLETGTGATQGANVVYGGGIWISASQIYLGK